MSNLRMKENEKQSRILEREKLIEEVKKLTLFDDVFMSVVLEIFLHASMYCGF